MRFRLEVVYSAACSLRRELGQYVGSALIVCRGLARRMPEHKALATRHHVLSWALPRLGCFSLEIALRLAKPSLNFRVQKGKFRRVGHNAEMAKHCGAFESSSAPGRDR